MGEATVVKGPLVFRLMTLGFGLLLLAYLSPA